MTTVNEVDDTTFPILSKRKEEINKLYIGGENNMSGLSLEMYKDGLKEGRAEGIEQGMQQGMQQGIVSILVRQFKDKKISVEDGANYLNITVDEFLKLVK